MAEEADVSGLRAQAHALQSGALSSVELIERTLDRIDTYQPTLNAFRVICADSARREATDADRRLAAGERLPLLGVPVAIKDDMDLAGHATAFGCAGRFPVKPEDGEVVRRLRAAGAVVVGKTNTPEFGQWPWAESPSCGVTRNPWSLEHTPGGSSAGSAAAVAAELVPAAVGSDGAGSIRIPAAWTGLVGIKPQRGRVSTWPDREAFNGLTVLGPLARTVADAALLLDVLAGSHPGDRHRPPAPDEAYAQAAAREPGRLTIGLSLRIPFSGAPARLDPSVEAEVRRLAEVLAGLGHEIVEIDPSYGPIGATFLPRSTAGVREWMERVPDPTLLDPRTRGNARTGRLLGGGLLWLARALERPLQAWVGRVFDHVDVVLAPTTARPPLRVEAAAGLSAWETDKLMVGACPYAWPWNVLGWPAINVPAGLVEGRLPVGAQLMGPENSEAQLIALAAQLEGAERWAERRPQLKVAG